MLISVVNMLALSVSRLAIRATGKTSRLAMSCVAATCCLLGLAGAGFDYSIANAAALTDDGMVGDTNLLAWDNLLGNMLTGSLGIVAAAAMVLVLSLWTAPQATMQVAPPHRQLYGEAD